MESVTLGKSAKNDTAGFPVDAGGAPYGRF